MTQTKEGAAKAKAKILANNPNHFREAGKIGGQRSTTGGFAYMAEHQPEKLKAISSKGGSKSRKPKN